VTPVWVDGTLVLVNELTGEVLHSPTRAARTAARRERVRAAGEAERALAASTRHAAYIRVGRRAREALAAARAPRQQTLWE
jgi:hypothetical protein